VCLVVRFAQGGGETAKRLRSWPGPCAAEAFDTVSVTLMDENDDVIYDTHGGDFDDESTCVGTARTKLDRGNISIEMF
jgi:hypothetical protein